MARRELMLEGGFTEVGGVIHAYLAKKAAVEGEIGVITFASDHPEAALEKFGRGVGEHGVKIRHIQGIDDCYGLSVIHMVGGNPLWLVEGMNKTGLAKFLRPHWKHGDVFLSGTSAGAMALFWKMLGDDDQIEAMDTTLYDGMGPMGGGFAVPHWDKMPQQYLDKLIAEYSDMIIMGIDENTAAVWLGGQIDVIGSGKVYLRGRANGEWGSGESFNVLSSLV